MCTNWLDVVIDIEIIYRGCPFTLSFMILTKFKFDRQNIIMIEGCERKSEQFKLRVVCQRENLLHKLF